MNASDQEVSTLKNTHDETKIKSTFKPKYIHSRVDTLKTDGAILNSPPIVQLNISVNHLHYHNYSYREEKQHVDNLNLSNCRILHSSV